MVKKAYLLILSALTVIGILGGCKIDVNEIVSKNSQSDSSSTAFYESAGSEESQFRIHWMTISSNMLIRAGSKGRSWRM